MLIPAGVWLLLAIGRHYRITGAALASPDRPHAGPRHHVVILIVPEMNRQIADMIAYGSMLSDDEDRGPGTIGTGYHHFDPRVAPAPLVADAPSQTLERAIAL